MPAHPSWTEITPSPHPWEREAFSFLKAGLPTHEPHRAWSNFEFVADDGTVNEVDALILTPRGLFLVEIKSHPGKLRGDRHTWTWECDGRRSSFDAPLALANRKAKRLAGLLAKHAEFRGSGERPPFVEALVFVADPQVEIALEHGGELGVFAREKRGSVGAIFDALLLREGLGGARTAGGVERRIDKPLAKRVSRALEGVGVRRTQKARRVGDYELTELIEDSPSGLYQEWRATHKKLKERERAVRIFTVARVAAEAERKRLVQAAEREARILEGLRHPGIAKLEGFSDSELGPALILVRPRAARRLDHVWREELKTRSAAERLGWLRELAEALAYAQKRQLVHRALSPNCIWLVPGEADGEGARESASANAAGASASSAKRERLVIENWAVGGRTASTSLASATLLATVHAEELLESEALAYLAPETFSLAREFGPAVDVFSLGALAYLFFAEKAPASGPREMRERLRRDEGLRLSADVDGVLPALEELVFRATRAQASERYEDAEEFLAALTPIEAQLAPLALGEEVAPNPLEAQPGAVLQHGWKLKARLGSGASSIVFLVERNGEEQVLKLASRPELSERLRGEAEVLEKLRHPRILPLLDRAEFTLPGAGGVLFGLLLPRVKETLAKRLREDGPLHLEYLQRFGSDLLEAIAYLEEVGIAHRDVKPENLGVLTQGRANEERLVLFDFSLSNTPPEQLRAGTPGYLDPFLELRRPRRWDLAAERYAAAIVLHEMATGQQPRWGDGQSDPALLDVEVTLQAESFPAELREGLLVFFTRALRKGPKSRFDNATEMRAAWQALFEAAEPRAKKHAGARPIEGEVPLPEDIGPATPLAAIAFGTRAQNALDRLNLLTVQDLLCFPSQRLWSLRGVGQKTRKQIAGAVLELRKRSWAAALRPGSAAFPSVEPEDTESALDPASADLDQILRLLVPAAKARSKAQHFTNLLLGFEESDVLAEQAWPTQREAALRAALVEGRAHAALFEARVVWRRLEPLQAIRDALRDLLHASGGAALLEYAASAIAAARGSAREEPLRTRSAIAVLRAALECEGISADARFLARRRGARVLLVLSQDHGAWAEKLGALADRLALEDPLPSSKRALELLRAVEPVPGAAPLSDGALLRLAASCSERAALSSRLELYPRGLSAERALRLSQSALLGFDSERPLSADELRQRVRSRYPEAAPLPSDAALAELIRREQIALDWDATTQSFHVHRSRESGFSLSTHSQQPPRERVIAEPSSGILSEAETDLRVFEKKLRHHAKEGGLLFLSTAPKHFVEVEQELQRFLAKQRIACERCDLDALFLQAMRALATELGADWEDTVLPADARDAARADRENLSLLFRQALPQVEERLLQASTTVRLVVKPGLLARFESLRSLATWKDRVNQRGTVPALWFLVPSSAQSSVPELGSVPLPIPSSLHLRVPAGWRATPSKSASGASTS